MTSVDYYRKWRPKYSKYEPIDFDRGVTFREETSIIGLCAEAGELLALVQKAKRKDVIISRDKVVDELGDVFWYFNYVMDTWNITYEELINHNMKKLDDRNK